MSFYVYTFTDPRTDKVFYIGKGTGRRVDAPRLKKHNPLLYSKIKNIREAGHEEIRNIVKRFKCENESFLYEFQLIQDIGLKNLCNVVPGGEGAHSGEDNPNWKGDFLVGRRFGKLLVVARSKKVSNSYTWTCRCDCGNTTDVSTSNLKHGGSKSCGCNHHRLGDKNPLWKGDYMVGHKYEKLEVISRAERSRYWICQCSCGNTTEISTANLCNKSIKSCGCLPPSGWKGDYMVGKKFGKLTVLSRAEKRDKWGGYFWACQCECGNIADVRASNLRANTNSCGCSKKTKK